MAANTSHTDVICLDESQKSIVPSCPHGPALLFERYIKSSNEVRAFFACSAFRDRKACNFFMWADAVKGSRDKLYKLSNESVETHKSQRKRYFAFRKLPLGDRHVCCTCGLLLLPGELPLHESKGHNIKKKLKLKALRQPSYLFIPYEDNKTYAQYLFSKKTVSFIIDALSSTFSHVLCIGTPRIHEEIQKLREEKKTDLNSFLLDLDQRYGQLYPPQQFTFYNMFNHHFFEKEGQNHLMKFLNPKVENGKIVFLVDPPFGGMVEPLVLCLSKLSGICPDRRVDSNDSLCPDKKTCTTPFMLFLPYFMEKRILDSMNTVTMLDYKVDYDNHDLYKNNVKKKGSPVRIFVHQSLASLELPVEDGYWWCDVCKRYSASENRHCKECGLCTSKDGTKYIHCDMCSRCVKPSRKHCFTCNMCQVHDHVCNAITSAGCYICGELDHKKRECPQKAMHTKKRPFKRKAQPDHDHLKRKKI